MLYCCSRQNDKTDDDDEPWLHADDYEYLQHSEESYDGNWLEEYCRNPRSLDH